MRADASIRIPAYLSVLSWPLLNRGLLHAQAMVTMELSISLLALARHMDTKGPRGADKTLHC